MECKDCGQRNYRTQVSVAEGTPKLELEKFCRFKAERIATDKDANIVFLAESEWVLRNMIEAYPEVTFHFTSEFKRDMLKAQ